MLICPVDARLRVFAKFEREKNMTAKTIDKVAVLTCHLGVARACASPLSILILSTTISKEYNPVCNADKNSKKKKMFDHN
jgi:hypothetical protein